MGEVFTRFAFLAFMFSACMGLCGCEIIGDIVRGGESADPGVKPVWVDDVPRIRPGIGLIVQVGSAATPPTTMQVLADESGDITLPYLLQAPVACDGLTLDVLRQKLVKAYSDYIKQPQVTVTFAPYDGKGVSPWGTVTVMGQVAVEGPVNMPATRDLTVMKALQAAGGLRPFANKSKIRVSRCDRDGKITQFIVDLDEIGKKGRIDKDITLRAGDVVWVPETWY